MAWRARCAAGLALALGALLVVLLAADLGVWAQAVLWCAPLLIIAVPLVLGRYAGEELLYACRTRRQPARRRPAASSPAPARCAPRLRVSGGRLIADALAERGPPRRLHPA